MQSTSQAKGKHASGKASQAAPPAACFAALIGEFPPNDNIVLSSVEHSDNPARMDFRPYFTAADGKSTFGLLVPRSNPFPCALTSMLVKRGRKAKKAPDRLIVAGPAPEQVLGLPKVQFRGFIKAVKRAHEFLSDEAWPGELHWWTALQFARQGYCRLDSFTALSKQLPEPCPCTVEHCYTTGSFIIWPEFISRLSSELFNLLTNPRKGKCFTDTVEGSHLSAWLELSSSEIQAVLLKEFADEYKLTLTQGVFGIAVSITGLMDLPSPAEGDLSTANAILESVCSAETATPVGALRSQYPSHQHVIAALFDQQQLIANSNGYVFTRSQLLSYANRLRDVTPDLANASIRLIKDTLQLPRREAEELRRLLEESNEPRFFHTAIFKGGLFE